MTDLASLKIAIDSTDVKSGVTALDGLTAAGKKTTAEVNRLERALKDEAIAAERAAKGLVTASSAAGKLRMQQGLAADAMDKVVKSGSEVTAKVNGMGKSSGLAGYQVQNLAYQLNDVAVSLASGQKPMTVFMQQGSQIAQIMMQAGLGTGGFVKAIGSMVGGFLLANPLILAAAGVMGVLAIGLGLVTEEINKTSAVTVTFQDTMLGAFDVVSAAVSGAVVSAFQAMGLDIGAVWESVKAYTKGAINFMIGASLAVPKVIAATYQGIPAAFGDAFYSAANLAIEALNKLAQMSAAPLNLIIDGLNAAFGTKLPKMIIGGIGAIANPYAGAMRSLGAAGANALVGAFTTDYVGGIADGISGAAQSRARARLAAAADKGGKDVGGAAGKAAGEAASKAMADEWAKRMADDLKSTMDILERSAGEAASRINSEITAASEADWSTFVSAFKLGEDLTAKMRQDMDDIVEKARQVQFEKLDATIDALDRLGGIGGSLGNIGAIARGLGSGDFSGVTGQIGGVLNLMNQTDSGKKLLADFGKKLDNVFGGSGQFTKTITSALNTFGMGVAVGGAVGGGGAGSQIGGAAGSFLGQGLGVLAGVGGPVGMLLGGIVGGLIGGLFKKAKTGSASVTQGGISIGGNNTDAKGNTGGIGGAVQGSLGKIIEALGGTAGSYGFSIGQREDEFRVSGSAGADVTGKNPGGLLYRGKSAEEAARIALLNAINDGAVAGIREGASNLLKSGKDLESALAKALKFNAVFEELAKEADPVKFAMDAVGKELADLKAIFDEAGASASDYAALEELSAIKRAKTYNEIIAPQRDLEIQIMRLEGKELEATAAERAMELAGLNASLRPLQERIYALTDEAAAQALATQALEQATATAKALNNERLGMEATLLDLTGDKAGALAIRRALEISAMDESLRSLQLQIYAQQDVAAARDVLNNAYQRERSELTATADKFTSLANSLRAFRATLYAGESGSSLASLRATGNMAALGSESAIGSLPGVASSFLASSRLTSSSLNDYKRDVARVATIVDRAIGGADGMASAAQQQLAALDKSVDGLIEVKESIITVEQAIADLREAMAVPTLAIADTAIKAREEDKQAAVDLLKEVAAMREENRSLNMKTVENTATMARFLARVDAAGVRVFNDNSGPIYTTAAV